MASTRRWTVAPTIPILACLWALTAVGAVRDAPAGFEALRIAATALPGEIPATGGVVLRTTVINPIPQSVLAHEAVMAGSPLLEVYAAGPTGDYERVSPADRPAASTIISPSELLPGFTSTSETLVWWGGKGSAPAQAFFSEPGDYKIKVRLLDLDGTTFIESAPVSITVTPPAPEDQAAFRVVAQRSAETGTFFLRTADPDTKRAEDLRRFVAEFGDSRYASYARFSLAKGLRSSHEPEQRAEAIPLLKSAVEDLRFPLRRHALYSLIEALAGGGDLPSRVEAQRYLSQLRTDYPDAERTDELRRLLEIR